MKNTHKLLSLNVLSLAILGAAQTAMAVETDEVQTSQTQENVQSLQTLTFEAQSDQKKDPDISAVPKTVISRDEMLQFGDQNVQDALRRAAGIQMPMPGQGPRGGNGPMRFRGGGAPVFLINGEPIQGGPRSGMSVIDSLTPDMIERIEVVKQPSVAQASVASSAVINIILKEPLEHKLVGGTARVGYGLTESSQREEERKNVSLQLDGRYQAWIYSLSANQMLSDTTSVTQLNNQGTQDSNKRMTERQSFMLTPRVEYEIDDQQKLIAEIFYRSSQTDGSSGRRIQDDENDSLRLNTRYERKDQGNSDKVRLTVEKQNETQITRSLNQNNLIDESVEEYGLAYDGVRKFDDRKQLKFGVDSKINELQSNVAETLDEQRYAMYLEGSWRFTDKQTVTVGARQEWLERSGLVEYSDQHLSPVLAHRYEFTDQWSLQTNLSKAFRNPRADDLMPTISTSTDLDAGTVNNPDRGGNQFLKPEKISAVETTLGYNTSAGGVNLTGYYRKVDNYIEKVIAEENGRFVERPINQDNAITYGVEIAGRYAVKQTENGHSFMVNGQLSTVRAKVEQDNGNERLASGVAPYTASAGMSYNYKPWQLSTSVNVNYTPEYTRLLDNQPYTRTSNERFNIDISATKRFKNDWAATLSARNILSTDYKERLNWANDGSLYQSRVNEAIPSVLISVEKKF